MSFTAKYEVEVKFRLSDLNVLEQSLGELGGTFGPAVEEIDQYYQHPVRDFAATDEGLRIRHSRLSGQELMFLTYKGPKIDAATKTRSEIDLLLCAEDAEKWQSLLLSLGFRPVHQVIKIRKKCEFSVQQRIITLTLDFLPALKSTNDSGYFVEIETLASPDELDSARSVLLNLAGQFSFGDQIRKGYLELILEQSQPDQS